MSLDIQNAGKFQDLLEAGNPESPYHFTEMFPSKTFFERSLSKKKLKVLKQIDPVIQRMLRPGEQVYFITQGVETRTLEQLFIGWIMNYFTRKAFVFTTERILLIHMKSVYKLGAMRAMIEYHDIMKVSASSFLGYIKIKFRNKKTLLFTNVPRHDRKYVRELLGSLINPDGVEINKSIPSISNLCPRCFTTVENFPADCGECRLKFKSPRKAALLSLLMPGLGDFYLGLRFLAVCELFVMGFFWLGFIGILLEALAGVPESREALPGVIVFIGILHFCDFLKSHTMASKGIMPAEKFNPADYSLPQTEIPSA